MHALSKPLFFTTGSVGLLVLVFLWSALKYGLFKLNYLIDTILNYKFAGCYLTDFLMLSPDLDMGQRVHQLKIIITCCIVTCSLLLIFISYLPRFSWQMRALSIIFSIICFTALSLFWMCLINGSEVIKTSEKSAIFAVTAITYLTGVFSLWYAMRIKSSRRNRKTSQAELSTPAKAPPVKKPAGKPAGEDEPEDPKPEEGTEVKTEESDTDTEKVSQDTDEKPQETVEEGNQEDLQTEQTENDSDEVETDRSENEQTKPENSSPESDTEEADNTPVDSEKSEDTIETDESVEDVPLEDIPQAITDQPDDEPADPEPENADESVADTSPEDIQNNPADEGISDEAEGTEEPKVA